MGQKEEQMRISGCIVLALLAIPPTASATEQCLAVKDIESFSQDGRAQMQVTTYENRLYDVTFKAPCAHNLGSHFVYQQWQLHRCLSHNDTLTTNKGGVCVVAQVREMPSHLPPGSGRGSPEVY
jgi:hypothetical protein